MSLSRVGTKVHNIEMNPRNGGQIVHGSVNISRDAGVALVLSSWFVLWSNTLLIFATKNIILGFFFLFQHRPVFDTEKNTSRVYVRSKIIKKSIHPNECCQARAAGSAAIALCLIQSLRIRGRLVMWIMLKTPRIVSWLLPNNQFFLMGQSQVFFEKTIN